MEIKTSSNYKKTTIKAVLSILLFILTYFILISLAIGLVVLCVVSGIAIVLAKPMFMTIIIGIGLPILGFLVFYFLIKFIFKKHTTDTSGMIEITRENEPLLFDFIEKTAKEVQTSLPKKIYLNEEVNASVFYNSSFWSMFLPIRKNLKIGMGLINTQTEQEFKAIISHEFGHFSQKTMKVGSYVYNVNHIISNMLFENEGFGNMSQKIASYRYMGFFVVIAHYIIKGIQWILVQLYKVVNLNYLALSREMEFQADEIAANIVGAKAVETSLLRLNLADIAMHGVLNFYGGKIDENVRSENIFIEQWAVMQHLVKENKIETFNGFPYITISELNKYNKSKLNIKDQCASHPSTEERIEAVRVLKISAKEEKSIKATNLFQNAEEKEKELTDLLFSRVAYQQPPALLNVETFMSQYTKESDAGDFSKIYNGYYNRRNPVIANVDELINIDKNIEFEKLYGDEIIETVLTLQALEDDKNVVKNIAVKEYKIRSFDYDGQKYTSDEAMNLLHKMNDEIEKSSQLLMENDKYIFVYFYKNAKLKYKENELISMYKEFYTLDKDFDKKFEAYSQMTKSSAFMSTTMPVNKIRRLIEDMEDSEKQFKTEVKDVLQSNLYQNQMTEEMVKDFQHCVTYERAYFLENTYNDAAVSSLFKAMNHFYRILSSTYYEHKKALLEFQQELI